MPGCFCSSVTMICALLTVSCGSRTTWWCPTITSCSFSSWTRSGPMRCPRRRKNNSGTCRGKQFHGKPFMRLVGFSTESCRSHTRLSENLDCTYLRMVWSYWTRTRPITIAIMRTIVIGFVVMCRIDTAARPSHWCGWLLCLSISM